MTPFGALSGGGKLSPGLRFEKGFICESHDSNPCNSVTSPDASRCLLPKPLARSNACASWVPEVVKHLTMSRSFTLKAADAMPAADYGVKLTPPQMSFPAMELWIL